MATGGSPTLRRRELGARLRKLRQDAGLTSEEVASRLLCSLTKVSRMETGERTATLRDIRDLCQIYEITDPLVREGLNTLAREARQRGWWQNYEDLGKVTTLIDLQTAAVSVTEYQTSVVPGLLQTEVYTRAIIRGLLPGIRQETLEERTEARLVRQRLLEGEDAPRYWVLLDESVLRRQIGGHVAMKAQLEKLITMADLSNITIQVIPYEVGAHPGLNSNFTFLEFGEELIGPVVFVEGLAGDLYLEHRTDIERYREAIEHLRAVAISPVESLNFIKKIVERGA
ncbi:MAG: hypothetical protein JWL58_7356 [Streptosporangiaceae bacterium]|jgi:transcriptional regulator with XRE-family HTH domain|nr:hypothetical protein [Streptosporangiaceae bacterium]